MDPERLWVLILLEAASPISKGRGEEGTGREEECETAKKRAGGGGGGGGGGERRRKRENSLQMGFTTNWSRRCDFSVFPGARSNPHFPKENSPLEP